MSDSDKESNKSTQLTEEEIIRDVYEKCYKAFIIFDEEGTGG